MNNKKLNISYFGKRDYIDVSTLSTALYEAVPELTKDIKDFDIRILRKVTNECYLKLVENTESFDKEKTAVIFKWQNDGKPHCAHFVMNDVPITERRPEPVEDPKDYMEYLNSEVIIRKAINNDCIYNLMKMGRLIVVNKYNLIPRVVRFHFDRLLSRNEFPGVVMKAEYYGSKNFYKLETFKDNQKFGEIIIQGLQPY